MRCVKWPIVWCFPEHNISLRRTVILVTLGQRIAICLPIFCISSFDFLLRMVLGLWDNGFNIPHKRLKTSKIVSYFLAKLLKSKSIIGKTLPCYFT